MAIPELLNRINRRGEQVLPQAQESPQRRGRASRWRTAVSVAARRRPLLLVAATSLACCLILWFHFKFHRSEAFRPAESGVPAWRADDAALEYWLQEPLTRVPSDPAFVTFVVPSKGRMSLAQTLASLRHQDDPSWNAIVVLDFNPAFAQFANVDDSSNSDTVTISLSASTAASLLQLPAATLTDPRIRFRQMRSSRAHSNFAGEMRNAAFAHINPVLSRWVGFVDDDDVLTPNYVSALREEEAFSRGEVDAVVFPMECPKCFTDIVPPPGTTKLAVNYVGISFALRTTLLQGPRPPRFVRSACEDYAFIAGMALDGYRVRLAPNVTYKADGRLPAKVQIEAIADHSVTLLPSSTRHPCMRDSIDRNKPRIPVVPKFEFPGLDDFVASLYFADNIAALRESLSRTVASGCTTEWPEVPGRDSLEISIMLHKSVEPLPTSDVYVQVQMEQITSGSVVLAKGGGWRAPLDPEYGGRLRNAIQIWEWSPKHLRFLTEGPSQPAVATKDQASFVPFWALTDFERWRGTCNRLHVGDKGERCPQVLRKDRTTTTCVPVSGCNDPPRGAPKCPSTADALFYGALTEERRELCIAVAEAAGALNEMSNPAGKSTVQCFDNLFAKTAEPFLCAAKVVFVAHSYEFVALEVHRINALLSMGKAVVAVHSDDTLLDNAYVEAGALVLTTVDMVPEAVAYLLSNDTARHELEQRALAFARREAEGAPYQVCQALVQLGERLRAKVESGEILTRSHVGTKVVVCIIVVVNAAIAITVVLARFKHRRSGQAIF